MGDKEKGKHQVNDENYPRFPPPIPPRSFPMAQSSGQTIPTVLTPVNLISAAVQQNMNWFNTNAQFLNLPNLTPLTINLIHHQMKVSSENIHGFLNLQSDVLRHQAVQSIHEKNLQSNKNNRFVQCSTNNAVPVKTQPAHVFDNKSNLDSNMITLTKIVKSDQDESSAASSPIANSPQQFQQEKSQKSSDASQEAGAGDAIEKSEPNNHQSVVTAMTVPTYQRFDVLNDEKFLMPRPTVKHVDKDVKFEIYVVKAYTPTDFWFQHSITETAELVTQMNEFYSSNSDDEAFKITAGELKKNLYVAARIHGEWNRAKVLTALEPDAKACKLRFIDFGSQSMVEVKDIRFLLMKFAVSPLKAFRGSLVGVAPIPKEENVWSRQARKSFYGKVKNTNLQASIKNISTDDVYLLEIYNEGSSIAEQMIGEGVVAAGENNEGINAILQ